MAVTVNDFTDRTKWVFVALGALLKYCCQNEKTRVILTPELLATAPPHLELMYGARGQWLVMDTPVARNFVGEDLVDEANEVHFGAGLVRIRAIETPWTCFHTSNLHISSMSESKFHLNLTAQVDLNLVPGRYYLVELPLDEDGSYIKSQVYSTLFVEADRQADARLYRFVGDKALVETHLTLKL